MDCQKVNRHIAVTSETFMPSEFLLLEHGVKVKGMQPELTVHPCFCQQPARRPAANTIGQECNRPAKGR